ncbi:MAG: hypothetical protein WAX69_11845 [Victivallales bacterium]
MHEYYLQLIEEINSLRNKIRAMESGIGIFHEKWGRSIIAYSDPRIKSEEDKNLLAKVVKRKGSLILRLEKAEGLVKKAESYYQKAEGVDKKVHNDNAIAADDSIKIAKNDCRGIENLLNEWKKKSFPNRRDQTIVPSELIPVIDEFIRREILKEQSKYHTQKWVHKYILDLAQEELKEKHKIKVDAKNKGTGYRTMNKIFPKWKYEDKLKDEGKAKRTSKRT